MDKTKIAISKIEFLFKLEQKLKIWGLKHQLWTDGENLIIEGNPITDFKFSEAFEKDYFYRHYFKPEDELIHHLAIEISLSIGLLKDGECDECGDSCYKNSNFPLCIYCTHSPDKLKSKKLRNMSNITPRAQNENH